MQRGLAGAVRPEHADEFARRDGQADAGQDGAAAERQRRTSRSSIALMSRYFGQGAVDRIEFVSIHCW